MGLDGEPTVILREVVQFLECLREVKLPTALESIRDNLLVRSKDTLTMSMAERRVERRSTSPEPYLDMSAAGPKGLLAASKAEVDSEEYVKVENNSPQKQQQDYYEAFQTVGSTTSDTLSAANPETSQHPEKQQQLENILTDIYASLSAAQTENTCQKCGPLYRKEGKKLFVFEQYRLCWVGLVGRHLLIYGNNRDNRPSTILPIRGYMARAAPNAIARDQRKSESAFEIFCPGSRTFQFVAKTPLDMEQWVMKICELGDEKKNKNNEHPKANATLIAVALESDAPQSESRQDSNFQEEQYQDVSSLLADKAALEDSLIAANVTNGDEEKMLTLPPIEASPSPSPEITNSPPPPLPARIPRRLPSLPVHSSSSSYQCPDEEEEDIYHRIEDVKESMHCYGNVDKTFKAKSPDNRPEELVTYDDVGARAKAESKSKEKPKKKRSKKNSESTTRRSTDTQNQMIYDDATSMVALKTNNIAIADEQDKLVSYDNVESLLSNVKSAKSHGTEKAGETERSLKTDKSEKSVKTDKTEKIVKTDKTEKSVKMDKTEKIVKTEEPVKSPQKKSFLDRVRSRKDSPQKMEKKMKRTVAAASSASVQESATFENVTYMMAAQEAKQNFQVEESTYTCPPPPRPIYVKPPTIAADAIEQQELYDDVSACREKYQDEDAWKLDEGSRRKLNYVADAGRVDADTLVMCDNTDYLQQSLQDNEHYQTPRSESNQPRKYVIADQQEELYDDIAILADFTARQNEVSGKTDSEDATRTQASLEKRSRNRFVRGFEEAGDFKEQQGLMRMNTFQKLINKMENSFGKASVKIAPSMLLSKTNVTNDA
ncbi:uncharacterized protein LOC143372856 [Andrena cerasifolii]|uniref:uncharacterized protein LOC143372856 n=1 Tax=Andrena cerasifolii TaxID=2819439 RepID=UPI004037B3CC